MKYYLFILPIPVIQLNFPWEAKGVWCHLVFLFFSFFPLHEQLLWLCAPPGLVLGVSSAPQTML